MMIYYILIFFTLCLYQRKLPVFHSLLISLTIFPALYYMASLIGVKVISNQCLDLVSLVLFFALLVYRTILWLRHKPYLEKEVLINTIIISAPFIALAILSNKSLILPVHDPIMVPSLAKLIFNAQFLPKTMEPLSTQPLNYPPGYSIFISTFYTFNNPFLVLLVFKMTAICVTAFTPAIWAYYIIKIYSIDLAETYVVILALYLGFFVFERTLPITFAFAGRNAVLYSQILFPAVFFMTLTHNKTWADSAINALAIFGLILTHYSSLFMFLILIMCHFIFFYNENKHFILRYISTLILLLILFTPFYLKLKESSFIALSIPGASLSNALKVFKLVFLSISNDAFWICCHNNEQWGYKKLLILCFFVIPAIHFFINKWMLKRSLPTIQRHIVRAIFVFALSILCSAIIFIMLFAKPLFHFMYISWFSHVFFSIIASLFIIYVVTEIKEHVPTYANIILFSILLSISTVYFFYVKDFKHIHTMVNAWKASYTDLKDLQHVLNRLSEKGKCYLITESTHIPGRGWNHTMQKYRPLDYYWVISDAIIINGSWLTLPFQNSRDLFELPSPSFFTSTSVEPIYFFGQEKTFSRYIEKLKLMSAEKMDIQIGGNVIYKMIQK